MGTETVSVRLNKDIKKEMKNLPQINWSEIIRRAVLERIETEKRAKREYHRIKKACKSMDQLRKKTSGRWDSTEEIRKWRDKR